MKSHIQFFFLQCPAMVLIQIGTWVPNASKYIINYQSKCLQLRTNTIFSLKYCIKMYHASLQKQKTSIKYIYQIELKNKMIPLKTNQRKYFFPVQENH